MEALVQGSAVAASPDHHQIQAELAAIRNSMAVHGRRRELLQVLHTTRALDSSLRAFLLQRHVPLNGAAALGGYLTRLANHGANGVGQLSERRRASFQATIVDPRNRFMHSADAYPTRWEADRLLNEMYSCLSEVLAL